MYVGAAALALLVPVFVAGCSDAGETNDPDTIVSEASGLDQNVLDNALLNEGQFADAGYALEGRAWVTPDVSLSFYVDQEHSRMVTWLMRAGVELDPKEFLPEEGESFEDFVARKSAGTARAVEVGSSGPNVLLFDPSAPEFENVNRLMTVGRNDHCPRAWFDSHCQLWAGINHAQFTRFKLTDRTASSTQSLAGVSGVMTTGCADLGSVDFSLSITNPRWGSVGGSFSATINQGNNFGNWSIAGWKQEEYCKTKVLGVCVDYAFRIKYQTFNASTTIRPASSGAEGHYCGAFTTNPDEYVGDIACERILTCPTQCPPGSTDPVCVNST
jgi:hypothetical protein